MFRFELLLIEVMLVVIYLVYTNVFDSYLTSVNTFRLSINIKSVVKVKNKKDRKIFYEFIVLSRALSLSLPLFVSCICR